MEILKEYCKVRFKVNDVISFGKVGKRLIVYLPEINIFVAQNLEIETSFDESIEIYEK